MYILPSIHHPPYPAAANRLFPEEMLLDGEAERTRKEQSFLVPVEEIREKGYDLSINKYKEIEREKVVYESSEVIFSRITSLQEEINAALNDFQTKFM